MRRSVWAGTRRRGSHLLRLPAAAAVLLLSLSTGGAGAATHGTGPLPGANLSETATQNFRLKAGSGVESVSAGQSFTATRSWGFNIASDGTLSVTGTQVRLASDGSGVDYTSSGFDFNYAFFNSDPNAFVQNHACPAPSATAEACPAPAVTLPPNGGEVTVFTGTVQQAAETPGFDSSRSVTPIPSSTDSAVAVTVTLNDPRYAIAGQTGPIAVQTNNDNADPTVTPTVTQNGQPLPVCTQTSTTPCEVPADFGAYQHSPAGGGTATCEALQMQIENPQPGTPYVFNWHENESAVSGCPTGEPGVQVLAFTPGTDNGIQACDAGTDCSVTQSFPNLGNVTTVAGPGQGITGIDLNQNAIYIVEYDPTTAPPPPAGTVSSAMGSSTTPSGTATATNDGTTASGTGVGGLTVSQWGSDPVTSPPFNSSGRYFDVQVLSGSSFSTVTLKNCNLANGDSLMWWNGTAWVPVSPQTYDAVSGCVTATLSSTSSPTISQLGGTPFAVVNAPVVALGRSALKLSGTRVGVVLRCTHADCRGTATLTAASRSLGRAAYSIAAGKQAAVQLSLNAAGRKALGHITRTRPFAAQLSIALAHGSPLLARVRVSR